MKHGMMARVAPALLGFVVIQNGVQVAAAAGTRFGGGVETGLRIAR